MLKRIVLILITIASIYSSVGLPEMDISGGNVNARSQLAALEEVYE